MRCTRTAQSNSKLSTWWHLKQDFLWFFVLQALGHSFSAYRYGRSERGSIVMRSSKDDVESYLIHEKAFACSGSSKGQRNTRTFLETLSRCTWRAYFIQHTHRGSSYNTEFDKVGHFRQHVGTLIYRCIPASFILSAPLIPTSPAIIVMLHFHCKMLRQKALQVTNSPRRSTAKWPDISLDCCFLEILHADTLGLAVRNGRPVRKVHRSCDLVLI